MYSHGRHLPQCGALAVIWLKKAAARGHTASQFQLGEVYRLGEMTSLIGEDFSAALKWYRKAAANGHAGAQYQLGRFYYSVDGRGVTENSETATKWYKRSAEGGDPRAPF